MNERHEPHLAKTHEQYPDGFPDRIDDSLLGHWQTPNGVVVVEHHPHGYEVHINPCYDFENCDECSPDRGPSNPHTDDGHHFRECQNRGGPILTVAGGEEGHRAVLEYLSVEGSEPHVKQFANLQAEEARAEAEMRAREREEHERQMKEQGALRPPPEERLAALEAELAELRKTLGPSQD
jgi:hypothetical protein